MGGVGAVAVDEIADTTGVALAEHDSYDTVSGLVLRHLGRTAQVGDVVQVGATATSADGQHQEHRTIVIEVLTVARHVPSSVRLSPHTQPTDSPASTADQGVESR